MEPDLAELTRCLNGLSAASAYHLRTAIEAMSTPGVGGSLVIEVANRVGENPVVKWVGGARPLKIEL